MFPEFEEMLPHRGTALMFKKEDSAIIDVITNYKTALTKEIEILIGEDALGAGSKTVLIRTFVGENDSRFDGLASGA
jgi:hypothetical protein